MNKKLFLTSAICTLGLIYSYCGKGGAQVGVGASSQQEKISVSGSMEAGDLKIYLPEAVKKQISLKTITPKSGPIKKTLRAMGKVLTPPKGRALVGFACPARIVAVHKRLGQWVKKGEALLTLECREVGDVLFDFMTALEEHALAGSDLKREERLFKKDIGSKKEMLEARARAKIALSHLNTLKGKLGVLGFTKKQIEETERNGSISSRISLNAPMSGKITKNGAIVGAMIDPAVPVMEIMELKRLSIDADIFEKDLALVCLGQEVTVNVPAFPGEMFPGKLNYIGDIVNQETRSITVRAELINTDNKLKPGMFAGIEIQVGQRDNALLVPPKAVLDEGEGHLLFVSREGEFFCREVVVGFEYQGFLEIISGLDAGEEVVVEGNYQLKSIMSGESLTPGHIH